jgi:CRP-like cAMP-binding protein
MVKTIEFLGRVPIFRNLSPRALENIATQLQMVSVAEGAIFREGDSVDGLYVINSGKAKVTKPAEGGGPEAVLAILGEGDSFGEVGLVDGLPRSANVSAMEPMECYYLGRAAFLSALGTSPEIAVGMLPALASMVRNADEWVSRTI